MDKPSSNISRCLKVRVPLRELRISAQPHPFPSRLRSPSTCHPLSSLVISVPFSNQPLPQSQRPPALPQEAVEEERGCSPLCAEPDTGWPFVPRLCCLHCFLALTMQVLTTKWTKIKGWRLEETASRVESWGGTELASFFSLPHPHHH